MASLKKMVLPLLCAIACLFCSFVHAEEAAYFPSYISGKFGAVDLRAGIYSRLWMKGMGEQFGDGTDPLLFLRPAAMVDNQGDLFTAFEYSFGSAGYRIRLYKNVSLGRLIYPWQEMNPDVYYSDLKYPKLVQDNSSYMNEFKNHVHNLFQHSIAQEMDTRTYDHFYFLTYMPPARYNDNYSGLLNKPGLEGLIVFKIAKSDLSIVDKKLLDAQTYPTLAYNRTPIPTYKWSYSKFNLLEGSCHGFVDNGYLYIHYSAMSTDYADLQNTYYMKLDVSDLRVTESGESPIGNTNLKSASTQYIPRFSKLDDKVYFGHINGGYYYLLGSQTSSEIKWRSRVVPALYLVTTQDGSCSSTTFHSDFCMVKSDTGIPIWCVLCFNSKAARGSHCVPEYNWDSTYMNWPTNNVCLCVYSYPLSTTEDYNDFGSIAQGIIYPSDTLYSTTLIQNCSSWAGTSSGNYISTVQESTKSDFYRLYLNTHKIVPYTSPSGKRYFIYAYCYPGKKTHAYIGYCTYSINSSNFVHLNTKITLRAPNSGDDWSDSFSSLTNCSRIISLDVKNNQVWMTWMSADNTTYYCCCIQASDLIPE